MIGTVPPAALALQNLLSPARGLRASSLGERSTSGAIESRSDPAGRLTTSNRAWATWSNLCAVCG